MLDLTQAQNVIKKNVSGAKIQKSVLYGDLYIFQVFCDRPFEEEMDPFYSVNKNTGVFEEYSLLTDAVPEVIKLFDA